MKWPGLAAAGLIATLLVAGPASADEDTAWDPLERMNRGIFWFNDKLDGFLLEPLARGWEFVTPSVVRIRIDKFFTNLGFPVRFVNNGLQGEGFNAMEEWNRFIVNTTLGVAGFWDPASYFGLGLHETDLGVTLGRWGVPPGPYLVLPLLGPSNPRDGVGTLGDTCVSMLVTTLHPGGPTGLCTDLPPAVRWGGFGLNLINRRALLLEDVREAKAMALDYYVFMRNAYVQRRRALVAGEDPDAEDGLYDDDLYEFDDE